MASVRIEGLDELRSALRRLPGELAQGVQEGHRASAERIANQVRADAPRGASQAIVSSVRTRYPSSFLADVDVGREGETEYLGHQEFGTSHQPARPFVRPAVARAEAAHEATMLAAARRRLK
jgi:HK97 gp10 family phage protein